MTKLSTEELVCPECDLEQLFTVYNSVNVSMNPEAKEKLIDGELTVFTCDACGHQIEMVYPILYHDMEKELIIYLDPDGLLDLNGLENRQFLFDMLNDSYRYRIVSTREELVEKIFIFEDDLDDKPLEMLKHYIRETHLGNGDDSDETILYYGGRGVIEDEGDVIFINKWSGPDQKSFRLPMGSYWKIKNEYTDHYPGPMPEAGRWLRVDENYFK